MAQTQNLQQRVAALRQAIAANKQAIAHYTWQMQQTVSVRGEVRQEEFYQVQIGPDGKQVKTLLSQPPRTGFRRHGIRARITDEYKSYGQSIAQLAQSYAQPDPGKLQALASQGNVALKPGGAGAPSSVVFSNYLKPGDSVSVAFIPATKTLLGMRIASYLSGPGDAVTIAVQFAKLPDGTTYASETDINGESKQLLVHQTTMNYAPQ